MRTRFLHLVRHGQYERGPERLTELGVLQVQAAGARLARSPVDSLRSSVFPRALESAGLIAPFMPDARRSKSRLLVEHTPGPPRRREPPPHYTDLPEAKRERWVKQLERAFAVFVRPPRERVVHEVIVCHGNVVRALICRAMDLEPGTWWDLRCPDHASISTIAVSQAGVRLVSFNDVGHLAFDQITQ